MIGQGGGLSAIDAAQQMLIPVLGAGRARYQYDSLRLGWPASCRVQSSPVLSIVTSAAPSCVTCRRLLQPRATGRADGEPELALDDGLVQPAVAHGPDDITWPAPQPQLARSIIRPQPSPPAPQLPLGATARVDPGPQRRQSSCCPVREPRERREPAILCPPALARQGADNWH